MSVEAEILSNLFSLLVSGLLLFPWVAGATLIGLFIFNFLQKKLRWKWLGAAVLSVLVFCIIVLLALNLLNFWNGWQNTDLSLVPSDIREQAEFQNDQASPLIVFLQVVLQSFISGILFTIVLFPFVFLGWMLFEVLKKRFPGTWPRLIITAYVFSLLALVLVIVFPWIPVSLVYLAYFGI